MIRYINGNVRSKADGQLNLAHGTNNERVKKELKTTRRSAIAEVPRDALYVSTFMLCFTRYGS